MRVGLVGGYFIRNRDDRQNGGRATHARSARTSRACREVANDRGSNKCSRPDARGFRPGRAFVLFYLLTGAERSQLVTATPSLPNSIAIPLIDLELEDSVWLLAKAAKANQRTEIE